MKTKLSATLCAVFVACSLTGCASSEPALVLDPVGPAPSLTPPTASSGTLLVFSAYLTGVPSPSLPDDTKQHSDYQLQSSEGKVLRQIANRTGYDGEDPLPVTLAAGRYRIVARANGYGLVTVPVVIEENRTTVVHLESNHSALGQGTTSVRLPHGEIVGWKATQVPPAKNSQD